MSQTCPTVKVKTLATDDNPEGFIVINESDFDPEVHELHGAEKPAKKPGIAELREAVAAKGLEVPEGATKAELQALLDA